MAAFSYCSSKGFLRTLNVIITVQCVSLNLLINVCAQTQPLWERRDWAESHPWKPGEFLRWIGRREGKRWFSGSNERWLWKTRACTRCLREEVEDRKFNVFEHWQITWLCLMIWQYLLTGCINIRAIHHFYSFIALGNTTFLSTHGFSCLVSWRTAS